MARLGRVVVEALVREEGTAGVLERLAHPFWFQALGCAMGMDWHSSGITTSVLGALKVGLAPVQEELGLWVCGGRGNASRKTPAELRAAAERTGGDGEAWTRASRLVAKVDNAAVQDGFHLYLHTFLVDRAGAWTVVQQGMQSRGSWARRYHWTSTELRSFVDQPHSAIHGLPVEVPIVNLTAAPAAEARSSCVQVVQELTERGLRRWDEWARQVRRSRPRLQLPDRHEVRAGDVVPRRLMAAVDLQTEPPDDFESLLLTPGLGPRSLSSIAIIAELVFGKPCRFSDPARFSYAHGGKDGHPFPVPTQVYDRTIRVWQDALRKARIGRDEKLEAIRRLDTHRRQLEFRRPARRLSEVEVVFERERRDSAGYGGRTAHGFAPPAQLNLPNLTAD